MKKKGMKRFFNLAQFRSAKCEHASFWLRYRIYQGPFAKRTCYEISRYGAKPRDSTSKVKLINVKHRKSFVMHYM